MAQLVHDERSFSTLRGKEGHGRFHGQPPIALKDRAHPPFVAFSSAVRRRYNLAVRSPGERGQSLVELALLLPLLMMIVLGAIDFGRLYFAYTAIANAAREGAMCASLASSCPSGATGAANAEV